MPSRSCKERKGKDIIKNKKIIKIKMPSRSCKERKGKDIIKNKKNKNK
jgi:hypothetical protein